MLRTPWAAVAPHATRPAHVIAFALLHGTAWGLRGPFMQAIRADYFGATRLA